MPLLPSKKSESSCLRCVLFLLCCFWEKNCETLVSQAQLRIVLRFTCHSYEQQPKRPRSSVSPVVVRASSVTVGKASCKCDNYLGQLSDCSPITQKEAPPECAVVKECARSFCRHTCSIPHIERAIRESNCRWYVKRRFISAQLTSAEIFFVFIWKDYFTFISRHPDLAHRVLRTPVHLSLCL